MDNNIGNYNLFFMTKEELQAEIKRLKDAMYQAKSQCVLRRMREQLKKLNHKLNQIK